MAKKMTKREYFTAILNKYPLTEEEEAFIVHELELLEKKNSSDKKPTAKQIANDSLKEAILNSMEPNRLYTISEMRKEFSDLTDLSEQRITSLVRQLKEDGLVVRIEEKRKAYFSLA